MHRKISICLQFVFRAGRNGLKCLRLVGMIRLHVYSLLCI